MNLDNLIESDASCSNLMESHATRSKLMESDATWSNLMEAKAFWSKNMGFSFVFKAKVIEQRVSGKVGKPP